MDVPDAEEIKNQFMDKLTSKLENFFVVDDAASSGMESAASAGDLTMVNTTLDSSVD